MVQIAKPHLETERAYHLDGGLALKTKMLQSRSALGRATLPMSWPCPVTHSCCPGPIHGGRLPSPGMDISACLVVSQHCRRGLVPPLGSDWRRLPRGFQLVSLSLAATAAGDRVLAAPATNGGTHLLSEGSIPTCLETKRALAILTSIFHIKPLSCAVGFQEVTLDVCKKEVSSYQICKQ